MNTHADSNASGPPVNTTDAQAVLEKTRRELREYLMGEPVPAKSSAVGKSFKPSAATQSNAAKHQRSTAARNNVNTIDWMGLVKAGAATWWRDHPLHVGATVLKPVVADYVRRKPVATLAIAAAAGAALVVLRPWRLASVTALGMSLVRSSNLPVMAASLVATVAENLQKEQS